MKKYKYISVILIFTILINALFPTVIYAERQSYDEVTESKSPEEAGAMVDSIMNNSTVSAGIDGGSQKIEENSNFGGWIASSLIWIFFPIVYVFRLLITIVAPSSVTYTGILIPLPWFTIQGLLTEEIPLVDANLFHTNYTGENAATRNIKIMVRNWYYGIWVLSVIGNLLMLMYIGIRMAMSVLPNDKAKYKKQLIGWFESMIILFIMHILIRLIFLASDVLVDILKPILERMLALASAENIELELFDSFGRTLTHPRGWRPVENFICYIMLVIYQFKFLFMYIKRFFTINLLVVISPLVTVTYSMDKAGDGQPQAFQMLIKELIANILLLPMHLLLYLVLIGFALNIIMEVPLFAVLLLIGVTKGEAIIKKLFKLDQSFTVEAIKGKEK